MKSAANADSGKHDASPPQPADASQMEVVSDAVKKVVGKVTSGTLKGIQDSKQAVQDLKKSLESIAGGLEKNMDPEESAEPAKGPPGPQGASVDPAEKKAMLDKLRQYIEALGIDVMKQVEQSVENLQKMSDEIEPTQAPPPSKP